MKKLIRNSSAELLIFTSQAGDDSIEVKVKDETVWLTQKLMAELFDVDVRTISEHLKNIFQSNELQDDAVIRKSRITAADGKKYLTQFYNLDAIITAGYRVQSLTATRFQLWVAATLKVCLIKGFILDDKCNYSAGMQV